MTRKRRVTQKKKDLLTEKLKKRISKRNKKADSVSSIETKGYHLNTVEKGKYKNGLFWSKKNKKEFVFRSTYEFAYLHILEDDHNVVSYLVEPFRVPYMVGTLKRIYIPDLMVLYRDGSIKILEIKPLRMVRSRTVQTKARAAIEFIAEHIKDAQFEFITEKDIFHTDNDYRNLLKQIK